MAIQNGVYSLAPLLDDTKRADIDGASQAAMANLQLYVDNDTNAQKVFVTTVSGYLRFRCLNSGQMYDVDSGKAVSGTNIRQYPANATPAQDWQSSVMGTTTINGESFDVLKINSRLGSNLVMDAYSAGTANKTNIWLYLNNNTDAQRWVLHKETCLDLALPVPAKVGLATTATGNPLLVAPITGTTTLYPTWLCGTGGYQLRYRVRGRYTGTDSWGEYGYWMSPDGSKAERGWKDPWSQTGADNTLAALRHAAGITFTVDQTTYDRLEVQVEVRRFQANGHATFGNTHGSSSTGTVALCYKPTLSVSALSFAPDGIRLTYTSDFRRNGNKIALSITTGGKTLVKSFAAEQLAYSGTLSMPFGDLSFIPDDGANCEISYTWTTIDTSINSKATKAITYTGGHGSSINATFREADGYTVLCSVGSHTTSNVWLMVDNGDGARLIACNKTSEGFLILPPLGMEYRVFVVTEDGSSWATAMITRPKLNIAPGLFIWNYSDNYTILMLDVRYDTGTERDYVSNLTSGRRTEVVKFGHASKKPISISGSVMPSADIDHAGYADFRRLSLADYATFRTPLGEWYRVAITEINESSERSVYKEVAITMKEVS